ncbi:unnamed protein product [Cyprideis torosa]|uniref:Uncharacterized protein n=1 Tax=Cyprideis torosa TaxID=163714 RepID=A0A7R8W937_9CRUS|nr:unnamed protein product [Cyprideis torosa]CAG0889315.1 unnamed protein product [Cyprideis torosa]
MTSILEQFERASLQTHVTPAVASDLSSFSFAGYVPVRSDEDVPIFTRQKVDFSPSHPLTHMAVSNGHLLLAMGNKSLLKRVREYFIWARDVVRGLKGACPPLEEKLENMFQQMLSADASSDS